jgi:hypothetical protein
MFYQFHYIVKYPDFYRPIFFFLILGNTTIEEKHPVVTTPGPLVG